jgi:hypothetical protein
VFVKTCSIFNHKPITTDPLFSHLQKSIFNQGDRKVWTRGQWTMDN